MGKGSELWDDSALVDAFDDAVATFKAMQGKNTKVAPSEKDELEDAAAGGEEPVIAETADERHREKDDSHTDLPCDATETPQKPSEESKTTENTPLQKTDLDKEKNASESNTYSSYVNDAERKDNSNQQHWDYNELLRKYYELEEQSRKVLEQLQQTNYWNYQIPGQSTEYQQQQVPSYSATAPDPQPSTTQSSSCCLNVPLASVSCCTTGQQSGGSACMPPSGGCSVSVTCDQCPGAGTTCPANTTFMQFPAKVSTNNDQVDKAAMMSAEGAINFMRSAISGNLGSLPRKEAEAGKDESTTMGMNWNFETAGTDSDLAVVLNAWYAAGFYTGRYLMQQSMKKS